MKKTLFFLFMANAALAQTDTTAVADSAAKVITTETILISSTRAKETTPATFVNLSKNELQKNNLGQDLPILLDNTPSVVTTSDAGAGIGYTGIRIRGTDATRINVTLNGVPVNDAESQGVFWVNTPDIVSSASGIQIQRGVGTSTNGAASFGGQISLQTLDVAAAPYGEAGVSLGSFQTFRGTLRAGTGKLRCGFFADASGSWINSKGYIDRASSNLRSWFLQAGYKSERSLVRFIYFGGREKTYQAWYGVPQDSLKTNRTFNLAGTDFYSISPPYKNETDNYGQDYLQLHWQQSWGGGFSSSGALFSTLGRGYYEQYKAGASITNYFPEFTAQSTDLVRQRWLSNVYYGGTFAIKFQRGRLDASVGGLGSQFSGRHFGKVVWTKDNLPIDKNREYYAGESEKTDANIYLRADYEVVRHLHLYADVQYRYIRYTSAGTDNDGTVYDLNHRWHFFNPKAGVLYNIKSRHSVYGSYAMGHREPNRDDLLAAFVAKTNTRPERMHNAELGYKLRHHRFPLSVNGYLMYYQNQLVLTGRLNDVGNPIKENVPLSYRTGIELSGSIVAVQRKVKVQSTDVYILEAGSAETYTIRQPALQFNYAISWSMNKINRFNERLNTYDENYTRIDSLTQIIAHNNTDISFSPAVVASLEVVATPVQGLEIALMNKAVSKQYLDNTMNESRQLKPFFYSHLRLSYALPLKRDNKEIKFTLLINNLFNRLFVSNGYTYSERYTYVDENNQPQLTDRYDYNYYYPQAGINWLAGVQVRF